MKGHSTVKQVNDWEILTIFSPKNAKFDNFFPKKGKSWLSIPKKCKSWKFFPKKRENLDDWKWKIEGNLCSSDSRG